MSTGKRANSICVQLCVHRMTAERTCMKRCLEPQRERLHALSMPFEAPRGREAIQRTRPLLLTWIREWRGAITNTLATPAMMRQLGPRSSQLASCESAFDHVLMPQPNCCLPHVCCASAQFHLRLSFDLLEGRSRARRVSHIEAGYAFTVCNCQHHARLGMRVSLIVVHCVHMVHTMYILSCPECMRVFSSSAAREVD